MTAQQKAAIEAMKEWLAHPAELGTAPFKIEIAGEFDRHEMHYYILKYKKSFFSPWLVGVYLRLHRQLQCSPVGRSDPGLLRRTETVHHPIRRLQCERQVTENRILN